MNRREFLRSAAAVLGITALGAQVVRAEEPDMITLEGSLELDSAGTGLRLNNDSIAWTGTMVDDLVLRDDGEIPLGIALEPGVSGEAVEVLWNPGGFLLDGDTGAVYFRG